MPKGTETILLVEDEEMAQELLRNLLEIEGIPCWQGVTAQEALEIRERHEDPFHLLITDCGDGGNEWATVG